MWLHQEPWRHVDVADPAIVPAIRAAFRLYPAGTLVALASSWTTTVSSGGEWMATLAGRVTTVEGDVRDHAARIDGVQAGLEALRQDMNAQFAGANQRFDAIDRRFDAVERRFEAVDRRFEAVDRRFDLTDAKISRQFVWLVGVQVMTLAAVVTSLATILAALSGR
jgi:tetrahydromethanopterin S-methyltransferase subunit G